MKTKIKLDMKWSCRVCLEQSENMLSIFTKDDSQILANKIADCGGIKIELNNHSYPDKICPKCLAFLNISYKFRTTCKNSDNLLRSLTENSVNSQISLSRLEGSSTNTAIANKQTTRKTMPMNLVKDIKDIQLFEEIVYQIETGDEEHDEIELEIENESCIKVEDHGEIEREINEEEENVYEINEDSMNHYYIDEEEQHEENKCKLEEEQKTANNKQEKKREEMSTKRKSKHMNLRRISNDCDSNFNSSNNEDNDNADDDYDTQSKLVLEKRRKTRIRKATSKHIMSVDEGNVFGIKTPESSICEYICEICGNKYKKKVLLDSHMRWHNEDKAYKCEVCGRAFTINFQLTRHMRVHTGDKPYSCNMCDRKFSDYSTCKKHQRTHTDERPFKCEICGKAFNYSHVLKVHMAVHTGEKPYACNQCDKKFSQPHHLKAHLATLSHQGNNVVEKSSNDGNKSPQHQQEEVYTCIEQLEDYNIQDNCEVVAIALEEVDS